MKYLKHILAALALVALTACGGGGGSAGSTPNSGGTASTPVLATATAAVQALSIRAAEPQIQADGSNTTTLIVSAVDVNNGLVAGAVVMLSATSGVINSSSGTTDASGQASFFFSSGFTDQSNRVATITTSSNGKTAQTQVKIVGGTITLDAGGVSSVLVGGGALNLSATVKDASGQPVVGTTVTFTTSDASKVAIGTTSAVTANTGIATISLTGVAAGASTITVSSNGISANKVITAVAAGTSFFFSSPSSNTVIATGASQAITVAAPGVANVQFVTTLGTFSNGQNTQIVPVSGGSASTNFSSLQAGLATIAALDTANNAKTASLPIVISPPVASANKILLNANKTNVAVSQGGVLNGININARAIRNNGAVDEGVFNVPVLFTLSGGPGGGEYLDRAIGFTDSNGFVSTTFFAGNQSSTQNGIKVRASIVGGAVSTGTLPSNSDLAITIGGQALSVAFSPATVIQSSADNTVYNLPFSVIVSDANGGAVNGTVVSLSLKPYAFSTGNNACAGPVATYCSEDLNGNGSLDAGEDGARIVLPNNLSSKSCTGGISFGSVDNLLTPPNSAAGTVPSSVLTGPTGIAPFTLTYLKGSAVWVVVKLTATVNSAGTESTFSSIFRLSPSAADVADPATCPLPASPYTN